MERKAGGRDVKNEGGIVVIEFFQTLLKYRGILFYRTLASLRADTRGLCLGYLWWFLEPVLNTALYYLIFGVLLGSKTSDFIAYLLIGTTVYQWFTASVMGAMGTITGRAHLYRQIPLPKYLFAVIGILSNTWKFCCIFSIVFVYVIISTGMGIDWHLLWIPVLMLLHLLVVFGFAIILSIGSAYLRDLHTFMSVVFRALMFISAIFWDVEKVPAHLESLFFSNPVATFIHAFRQVVMQHQAPNMYHLLYLMILGIVLIQIGIFWHRRVDGHILKHVQG